MNTPNVILDRRLPARLAELNIFIVLASALEDREPQNVVLKVGSGEYTISNARLLLDVMADGAVVISRNLLQFLGITYQNRDATLIPIAWKPDDLKISDFGLPRVTAAAAVNGWPEGAQRAEELLKLCFETGNKVSAHFTTRTALMQNATIPNLCEAFTLVMRLVNREVYRAAGLTEVSFTAGGRHGHVAQKDNQDL